ncbi:MAG: hypothetical protein M0D57_12550 [Sphingobacteriales bacterium JAD_PAG50586_3]|nr:MAG: hypothetical protein M0D57_12550 [Sphingobacteriales bacterium JAD_PAG50586_3]
MSTFFTRSVKYALFAMLLVVAVSSCKKGELVPDNNAPYYDGVPLVKVQNYVNRLYIDLIGREPLDVEMTADVATLRAEHLSMESRDALITKLQTDTNYIAGDSSYFVAYYNRLYNLFKFRLLEGASDAEIDFYMGLSQNDIFADSLSGDSLGMQRAKLEVAKYKRVKAIPFELRSGVIDIRTAYARLLNNGVYDFINMNSFNFVRASFNDLFGRYPTQSEFDVSFAMVDANESHILFGQPGQNKGDFINILVNSHEFKEGLIRWAYKTFMARDAASAEVNELIQDLNTTLDFPRMQKEILKTDEYANF